MKKLKAERGMTVITVMLLTYLSALYALWHIASRVVFGEPLLWYGCVTVCVPAVVGGALLGLLARQRSEVLQDVWSVVSILLVCLGGTLLAVAAYVQRGQYEDQLRQILYPGVGSALEEWEYWVEVNRCDLEVHELQVDMLLDMLAMLVETAMVLIMPLLACGMTAGRVHQEVYGWEKSVGPFARKCYAGAFLCGVGSVVLYAFQDGNTLLGCGLSVTLSFALLWCTIYTCSRYLREEGSVGRKTIIK